MNLEGLTDQQVLSLQSQANKFKRANKLHLNNVDRYMILPIKDFVSWRYYLKQKCCLWIEDEVKFDMDIVQFNKPGELTPRQRELFMSIVGFFIIADGGISSNISSIELLSDTYEQQSFLKIQNYIEEVHSIVYSRFWDEVITNPGEKEKVIEIAKNSPNHKAKMEFIEKYMFADLDPVYLYAAAACMEGIFFMALFPIIFYFIKFDKLPGFTHANELIFRDETIHREFYAEKVKELIQPEHFSGIVEIVTEALEIERGFVRELMTEPIVSESHDAKVGITPERLDTFLLSMADQLYYEFGLPKLYNVNVHLTWMDTVTTSHKTNKYDKTVGAYARTGGLNEQIFKDTGMKIGRGSNFD